MTAYEGVRNALAKRLQVLDARVARLDADMRAPLDADFAEQATELEGAETDSALEETARAEIAMIRAALDRIADGRYGLCSVCGVSIPTGRLEALPYATRCVDCADI